MALHIDQIFWLSTLNNLVNANTSQVALGVKNLPANAGDVGDEVSFPGLERFPGEGNGNPLQYSCLEYSTDREAWRATVHGVTKSDMTG